MFAVNDIESTQLIRQLSEDKAPILIDVRTVGEMFQGIIPGCRATPLNQLPSIVESLPRDQDVVFYCRTGARSAQACAYLKSMGFQNTLNLRGGIIDYARQGGEIVAPDPAIFDASNAAPQYGMGG